MQDLVSILTPFKNTEHYLSECIESVMNQTYSNWELILIDDHSTDNGLHLVSTCSAQDHRIKVFKNEGNGIIDALRLAFSKAAGNYITRMDSDDIMLPNKLEVLVTNLKSFGLGGVAIGLVNYFSEEPITEGYKDYENWLNRLTRKGENFKEIYKECSIPSPCWMIHKEDLIGCGAFDVDRYPEDYDLTFRFYEHDFTCIPCQEVLHLWREYPSRTSRTHEHYSIPYFLSLKLHYFLKIDYRSSEPLVIWGVGDKGKYLAKELTKNGIDFYWISANPKKIGKRIGSIKIHPLAAIEELARAQHIITVANTKSQHEMVKYFENRQLLSMQDFYFFC